MFPYPFSSSEDVLIARELLNPVVFFLLTSGWSGFDHACKSWIWRAKLYWKPSEEDIRLEENVCREGNYCILSFYVQNLCKNTVFIHLYVVLKGMNPWIEVDGGVTPVNAYKVYEYPF